MQISESLNQPSEIIPLKIRLLCIAGGSLSGLVGTLLYGPLFWIFPSILVLGAIAQPYLSRAGRWIVAIGALISSIYTFIFITSGLGTFLVMFHNNRVDTSRFLAFLSLFLGATILALWSDVALILDAKRLQRTRLP